MQIKPFDHNPDLARLITEGLDLEVQTDCVLVKGIPYLNNEKQVKLGTLVSSFSRNGNKLAPQDHTCSLLEDVPHDSNGIPLNALFPGGTVHLMNYSIGQAKCYMSVKPSKTGKYKDFYSKFKKYISLISRHIPHYESYMVTRNNVTRNVVIETVFYKNNISDIEAGIQDITYKLKDLKIAIIGLGGTGSFILDYVSKTEVKEIHIFDSDFMKQKNIFRIPGFTPDTIIPLDIPKVKYLSSMYETLRTGIYPHVFNINKERLFLLDNMNFVFICIDKTVVKKELFEYLIEKNIPFVDVGMGIDRIGDESILRGQIRTTLATKEMHAHVSSLYSEIETDEDDEYSKNIQIIELNALNASIAVIKWKKLFGVYQGTKLDNISIFVLGSERLFNANKT